MSDQLLTRPALFVWFTLIIVPTLWPYLPALEGRLLPVVSHAQAEEVHRVEGGVTFYVAFEKNRSCEFRGISWYDGPHRLILEFEPDAELAPATRPVGEQFTGPWLLRGVSTLEGTTASVAHDCHPLWRTVTEFYP